MSPSSVHADDFHDALIRFSAKLTRVADLAVDASPEDQLKAPVQELLQAAAADLDMTLDAVTEVRETEVHGRPDVGVLTDGLLTGHVELKAPGKGANTRRYKGRDRQQWKRFSDLPNVVYTDGNEWSLYRTGEREGHIVRMAGDVTADGADAISETNARSLFELLRTFLGWEPIAPKSPRALADQLAPICRLLREDVREALEDPESSLSSLAADWRRYLFPGADDDQFADAYAQTLTYALLLARLSDEGAETSLSIADAVETIRPGHRLLADTLRILSMGREEIEVPVSLLERIIGAVDVDVLTRRSAGDPWLYFYEDFLAAYDPKLRKDRGVYYTPVPVVKTQVSLIAELLQDHFDAEYSFSADNVTTLDPAAGTGTYILTALEHALDQVEEAKGPGMRASAASTAARNIHGFELLVGPYAVAHLRLTQAVLAEGGHIAEDGARVYLTDTLESPYAPQPPLPTLYRELGEEHERAKKVKADTPIVVCLGNPPYDRQHIAADDDGARRKGGWVRYGDTVDVRGDVVSAVSQSEVIDQLPVAKNDFVYADPEMLSDVDRWLSENRGTILEQGGEWA